MSDVFPRRNLGEEADPWGRHIEGRILQIEALQGASRQDISGQNRTSAATLADLGRSLTRLQNLYDSIPQADQATETVSNFALPSGWNTISRVFVAGRGRYASVLATGSGFFTTAASGGLVTGWGRIIINGDDSPGFPFTWTSGTSGFHSTVDATYSWEGVVSGPVEVEFQVAPDNSAMWPPHTQTSASLTAYGTFSR